MSLPVLLDENWTYGIFPFVSMCELASLALASKALRALCTDFLAHHLTPTRIHALLARSPQHRINYINRLEDRGIFKTHESILCYATQGIFELRTSLGEVWFLNEYHFTPLFAWYETSRILNIQKYGFVREGLYVFPCFDRAMRLAIARIKLEEAKNAFSLNDAEDACEPALKKQRVY
jgi:hypothetical protein